MSVEVRGQPVSQVPFILFLETEFLICLELTDLIGWLAS